MRNKLGALHLDAVAHSKERNMIRVYWIGLDILKVLEYSVGHFFRGFASCYYLLGNY
jgi:hypothetical protein